MPKKTHARRKHHKENAGQEGFIAESSPKRGHLADTFRNTMNRNDKIIMGLLIGGIITFLVLSIILLFGRGGKEAVQNQPYVATTPTVKVLTTPYPTIPPVTDFLMQVNETHFYPDTVSITKGHKVTILNIGSKATTLTPTAQGNTKDFGTIEPGDQKEVMFEQAGVYRYTRTGKPDEVLTISVN